MSLVAIQYIPPNRINEAWPVVARVLGWQNKSTEIDLPALRNRLLIDYSKLWVAPDWRFPSRLSGVIVTTIVQRPRREPCLRVEFLSGRRIGTWIESAACTLSRHAQACGCTHLELIGRQGWREYRTRFTLPTTWMTEERATRCQSIPTKQTKPE